MKIERVVVANETHEVILISGKNGDRPKELGADYGWWVFGKDPDGLDRHARDLLKGEDKGWKIFPSTTLDGDPYPELLARRPRTVEEPTPSPASPAKPLSDMKEALSSVRKADTTHIRTPLLVYGARACEYGSAKYERANYLRPVGGPEADYERLRAYLRAAKSHIEAVLDSMEMHQSKDPKLVDVEGMKTAAYCEDTDTKPGDKVGPSGLPHLCGAVASLMMGITQATVYGLLPADPGQPWTKRMEEG